MRIDPYNSKQLFENWIALIDSKKEIDGLNEGNSTLMVSLIKDMKIGRNVSNASKKGERSFTRLNHLRQKLGFVIKKLEIRFLICIFLDLNKDFIQD
tara:strand:+ start:15533 stop:15823 length:291 start_codon:yes stop_codon:yes gene_type:complete